MNIPIEVIKHCENTLALLQSLRNKDATVCKSNRKRLAAGVKTPNQKAYDTIAESLDLFVRVIEKLFPPRAVSHRVLDNCKGEVPAAFFATLTYKGKNGRKALEKRFNLHGDDRIKWEHKRRIDTILLSLLALDDISESSVHECLEGYEVVIITVGEDKDLPKTGDVDRYSARPSDKPGRKIPNLVSTQPASKSSASD